MQVEVIYALPERAESVTLALPEGTTAHEAIALSGLLQRHPEIDRSTLSAGLYGRRIRLDQVLHDGDRLEIYRPLRAVPGDLRQRRAARSRTGLK